jgi:RNA polymerase sigma factor (sigma-70 family)
MTPLLSDARLADQATAGNRRAFAAIYRRYHQGLYRFCLSILSHPEDAQEALQNTMVKALRSLPGETREIKLKPWLYRVAHNESIDLLRRRREGSELEDQRLDSGLDIAETAATRERLGRLLTDLAELPERQRSALVMRELAGLGYEQIGEAFETSGAVARQTVYEARIALRELEAGREMDCKFVGKQLSDADGRTARRRDIRAHLRACPECRALRDSIDSRQRELAMLAPLPAAAAASLLHGIAGGGATAGGVGGSGGAGVVGAGIGKVAATPVTLKAVATVAVAAAIGVAAADRGGLIDADRPGGGQATNTHGAAPEHGAAAASGLRGRGAGSGLPGANRSARHRNARTSLSQGHSLASGSGKGGGKAARPATAPASVAAPGQSANQGRVQAGGSGEPQPEADQHGRQTAAAHKANGRGSDPGNSGEHRGAATHSTPPGQAREAHDPANGKANGKGRAHAPGQDKREEAAPSPDQGPSAPGEPAAKESESPSQGKGESGKSEASS